MGITTSKKPSCVRESEGEPEVPSLDDVGEEGDDAVVVVVAVGEVLEVEVEIEGVERESLERCDVLLEPPELVVVVVEVELATGDANTAGRIQVVDTSRLYKRTWLRGVSLDGSCGSFWASKKHDTSLSSRSWYWSYWSTGPQIVATVLLSVMSICITTIHNVSDSSRSKQSVNQASR